MSDDSKHECGLRGCGGECKCDGYGYLLPGKTLWVCRCDSHLNAAVEASRWECRNCGREHYGDEGCVCNQDMWGDQAAPTRGFLGDAAW